MNELTPSIAPQIIVLAPDQLEAIIERTAARTSEMNIEAFERRLAEQKEYYTRLLTASEIAAELNCSPDSVYRYWRRRELEYSFIKPNEKGSSRAQIDKFRADLKGNRE